MFREEWGCDKESDEWAYDLGGEVTKRCPNSLSKIPFVYVAFRLYGSYKNGITPGGKGLRNETSLYQETMAIIEANECGSESWYIDERSKEKK